MKIRDRILHLLMNGKLIGKLEKTAKDGLTFAYDQEWLNTPDARPISLSLPLTNQLFIGDTVYNFFDNLLPDNPQIRARIQAKFHITTNQPFDLLTNIGKDCVGAIQLINGNIPNFKPTIHEEQLSEKEIASILRGYKNYPLGMVDNTTEFRISIAGAQEKYRLTPLYDIMSAYPLIAKKQLQKQKIKMAMALQGENNHYYWHNVRYRHFISTAKAAHFSTERAETILNEMLSKVDTVIEKTSIVLPEAFPKQIAQSIFDGMQSMKQHLLRSSLS
jgi:HipA-like protein